MKSIYEYKDFREFLQDRFTELQENDPNLSLRGLGRKGGFDPALMSKILLGKRKISKNMIPKVVLAFELKEREGDYLELLVAYNSTTAIHKRELILEEMMQHNRLTKGRIQQDQHEYFQKWYYSAVREFINTQPRGVTAETIADSLIPTITHLQAQKSLDVLQNLGFIQEHDGVYTLHDKVISTGYPFQETALITYLQKNMELAKESFERFERPERNHSNLTFSIDQERIPEVVEKIRNFRSELLNFIVADENPNRVYQLNLQLFPVSKKAEEQ